MFAFGFRVWCDHVDLLSKFVPGCFVEGRTGIRAVEISSENGVEGWAPSRRSAAETHRAHRRFLRRRRVVHSGRTRVVIIPWREAVCLRLSLSTRRRRVRGDDRRNSPERRVSYRRARSSCGRYHSWTAAPRHGG